MSEDRLYSFGYQKAYIMEGDVVIAAPNRSEAWRRFWQQCGDIDMKFTGDEYEGAERGWITHDPDEDEDDGVLRVGSEPLD